METSRIQTILAEKMAPEDILFYSLLVLGKVPTKSGKKLILYIVSDILEFFIEMHECNYFIY